MEQKLNLKKQDLKEGAVSEAESASKKFAVVMQEGKVYVLSGECTHEGGPLGQGSMDKGELICPWHSGAFNVTTGKASENTPWATDATTYQARVDEASGEIFIDL